MSRRILMVGVVFAVALLGQVGCAKKPVVIELLQADIDLEPTKGFKNAEPNERVREDLAVGDYVLKVSGGDSWREAESVEYDTRNNQTIRLESYLDGQLSHVRVLVDGEPPANGECCHKPGVCGGSIPDCEERGLPNAMGSKANGKIKVRYLGGANVIEFNYVKLCIESLEGGLGCDSPEF